MAHTDDADVEFGWEDARPKAQHGWLTPSVRSRLPSPATHPRLLDMGCGNGVMADRYREWGFDVVGTEVSTEGLAQARAAFPGVRFVEASCYDDHRALGMFDVVVSTEVIEHLLTPSRLLERAFEALRPGGVLIVTTPYHGYVKNLAISLTNRWDGHWDVARDGWHIKFFSRRTLEAMVHEAGFRDLTTSAAGGRPLIWKSLVVRAVRPGEERG